MALQDKVHNRTPIRYRGFFFNTEHAFQNLDVKPNDHKNITKAKFLGEAGKEGRPTSTIWNAKGQYLTLIWPPQQGTRNHLKLVVDTIKRENVPQKPTYLFPILTC
jgi:hypothetical protein